MKGVDRPTVEYIKSMLAGRRIRTQLWANLWRGGVARDAQGGVLSPLLWSTVVDGLLVRLVKKKSYQVIGYADDVVVLVRGKFA